MLYLTLKSFFLLTTLLILNVQSAKILFLSFISSKSHKIIYEPLLHKLAERGHEVTIVNPIKSNKLIPNVRNIQPYDPNVGNPLAGRNLFDARAKMSDFSIYFDNPFYSFMPYFESGCRRSYSSSAVQEVRKEKFDLILFTPLLNDCLYGLIHEMNTTTIALSQLAIMPWVAGHMGSPTLPAFVPLLYYGFPDRMKFWERTVNLLGILYYEAVRKFYYNPRMERIYREFVNKDAPGIDEIARDRTSMVLVNSHFSFDPPRPLMPDIVEVGGMHLKEAQPLPKELQDFCDGAEEGFILFSMGSFLEGRSMPERYRTMFLRTFSKLQQRILWKWETESMPDLPENVKLSSWLPQPDLLAHEKIRLFITHGGHGGTTEALYEGVPLVGIPMFADQYWNMEQAMSKGFALVLNLAELTEESLTEAVSRVLNESSFRERAKFYSKLSRDNLIHPLDRAVYSVEYVLRHGGASHLRSPARDLNFFQYYSLDVLSFLGGILFIFLVSFCGVVRMVYKLFAVAKGKVCLKRKLM